jgi:eukaryotic-like serine/threonine-protein kinase
VPDVVGQTRDDAVATLAREGFEANVVPIFSDKQEGIVTAQDPQAGEEREVGTRVRINVSQGEEPLTIPSVIGQPYESAASALQGAGFRVARRNVDSDQPAGTVVDQQPAAGATAPRDTTVTLSVSRGPTERQVPNVEGLSEGDARETIEESGFQVEVQREPTDDPNLNGFVLRQDPPAGSRAPEGSTVTIVVGQFTE